MEVSVVIPTLNEERFISRCLESLLNQTVPPAEIIIVDAGSSDRTVELASRYTDKILYSPVANVAYQRELGVAQAKGEFILIADADTVFPPRTIELMLQNFADPEVAAVTVNIAPLNPNLITHLNCWFRNLVTPRLTQRGCCFGFRRSALLSHEAFSVDGWQSWQDVFPLRAKLKGKVIKDNKIVVFTDIPPEQQLQTLAWIAFGALAGYALLSL